MQLFTARVKFPAGKVFEGRYGERQNLVVEGNRGEATVWFNAGDDFYCSLERGQTVQIFNKGTTDKPNWRIVEPEEQAAVVAVSNPQPRQQPQPEGGQELYDDFQEISKQVRLYEFAYDAVCRQFEVHNLPIGEKTKIATTVFINFAKR